MFLEQLPPELLHRICEDLRQDVPSFRLACRLFAAVGAEHLLRDVEVYYARESFDKIRAIAATPVAKGLRALCFHAARLAPLNTFAAWNKERWSSDPDSNTRAIGMLMDTTSHDLRVARGSARGTRRARRQYVRSQNERKGHFSKAKLKAGYEAFQRLYEDQERLKQEDGPRKAMAALFKASPKLDSIMMSSGNQLLVTSTTWAKAFREGMVYLFMDYPDYYTGLFSLQSLLLGAADAGKQLRRLVVEPISHAFFEFPPEVAPQMYQAMGSVEELHIGLHDVSREDDGGVNEEILGWMLHDMQQGKMAEFLASARKLEFLSIRNPGLPPDSVRVRLRDLVGSFHWPHLQKITLDEFECSDIELHTVLMRHRQSPSTIHLTEVTFTSGDCDHFFSSIAGKLDRLKNVRLRGVWSQAQGDGLVFTRLHESSGYGHEGSPWCLAWERYVLQGGEKPDPEIEYWDEDDEDDFYDYWGSDDGSLSSDYDLENYDAAGYNEWAQAGL